MGKTNISWTDFSWNIARGCHKVYDIHPGTLQKVSECEFCYMYRQSLKGTRHDPEKVVQTSTKPGGAFTLPLRLPKKEAKVFLSSLTDFWHKDIDGYRVDAFRTMYRCPWLIYQIPTKRPERMPAALRLAHQQAHERSVTDSSYYEVAKWLKMWIMGYPPPNVWLGVSAGQQHTAAKRIAHLFNVPAAVYWVSAEPTLEYVNFTNLSIDGDQLNALTGEWASGKRGPKLDWIVLGGESGNETGEYRYRPCHFAWLDVMVADAKRHGTAIWVKQMGTYLTRELGIYDPDDRHGTNPDRWPLSLQVQDFPAYRVATTNPQ